MENKYYLFTYSCRYGDSGPIEFETIVTDMPPADALSKLVNRGVSGWGYWAIIFAMPIDEPTYQKYKEGFDLSE